LTGGKPFSYRKTRCGTAATDGWAPASPSGVSGFVLEYNVGDFTSLNWRVECVTGMPGAQPVQVYPSTGFINYTTAGIASRGTFVLVDAVYTACRIGAAWVGADGGTRDEVNMTLVQAPK
jgi:hypothetical protein